MNHTISIKFEDNQNIKTEDTGTTKKNLRFIITAKISWKTENHMAKTITTLLEGELSNRSTKIHTRLHRVTSA